MRLEKTVKIVELDPQNKGVNGVQEERVKAADLSDIVPDTESETKSASRVSAEEGTRGDQAAGGSPGRDESPPGPGNPVSIMVEKSIDGEKLKHLIVTPSGCGEQNMIALTPTVIAVHYLDNTQQWENFGVDRRAGAIELIRKAGDTGGLKPSPATSHVVQQLEDTGDLRPSPATPLTVQRLEDTGGLKPPLATPHIVQWLEDTGGLKPSPATPHVVQQLEDTGDLRPSPATPLTDQWLEDTGGLRPPLATPHIVQQLEDTGGLKPPLATPHIVQQLEDTGGLKPPLATLTLSNSYTQQLAFRKPDSSYAAFTNRPSSTWLTAYVVKVFAMARKLTDIEHGEICGPVKWLILNKQKPDGVFQEDAPVIHKEMVGGYQGAEPEVSLTAFVLIALEEARDVCKDHVNSLDESITKAAGFLARRYEQLARPYTVALASYALALAGKLKSEKLLMRRSKGGASWEEHNARTYNIEGTSYALLALAQMKKLELAGPVVRWLAQQNYYGGGYGSTQVTILVFQALAQGQVDTQLVSPSHGNSDVPQVTILVLQALAQYQLCVQLVSPSPGDPGVPSGHQGHPGALVRSPPMSPSHGDSDAPQATILVFQALAQGQVDTQLVSPSPALVTPVSPQATILVFQALAQYQLDAQTQQQLELDVSVLLPRRASPVKYRIENRNALVARSTETKLNEDFTVKAEGVGKGTMTVVTVYHAKVPEKDDKCDSFDLSVDVEEVNMGKEEEDVIRSVKITICTRYLDAVDATMSILDVSMLTGFSPDVQDLRRLSEGVDRYISKFELDQDKERSNVVIYLDKVSHKAQECFAFKAHQRFQVGLIQPAAVSVYSYYKIESCFKRQEKPEAITVNQRVERACEPGVDFVYKVRLVAREETPSHDNYIMNVLSVIKMGTDEDPAGSNRTFVSHRQCRDALRLRGGHEYLVWGQASDLWVTGRHFSYLVGKDTWLEEWPSPGSCQDAALQGRCQDFLEFAETMTLFGCPS
ncbi:hypothetical protein DUI87_35432 [Hirundo rustica rustica]|uniref:NTR domain-containing protein n=1 Tax=Hirundo rustica rustica TaxID=333673 RepID=A0A3M0IP69_HIRRU|nr:hypothetical protein DUI87_35432 [Hirundo rustica rustica]